MLGRHLCRDNHSTSHETSTANLAVTVPPQPGGWALRRDGRGRMLMLEFDGTLATLQPPPQLHMVPQWAGRVREDCELRSARRLLRWASNHRCNRSRDSVLWRWHNTGLA